MRSGTCPKCGGQRIAKTDYTIYLGGGVSGPTIDVFACADCRYLEQYLRGSVESRVAVLDNWEWIRTDEGPFR